MLNSANFDQLTELSVRFNPERMSLQALREFGSRLAQMQLTKLELCAFWHEEMPRRDDWTLSLPFATTLCLSGISPTIDASKLVEIHLEKASFAVLKHLPWHALTHLTAGEEISDHEALISLLRAGAFPSLQQLSIAKSNTKPGIVSALNAAPRPNLELIFLQFAMHCAQSASAAADPSCANVSDAWRDR